MRKNPSSIWNGLGYQRLIISVIDCIWAVLSGCVLNEDYFIQKEGVFHLLDILEVISWLDFECKSKNIAVKKAKIMRFCCCCCCVKDNSEAHQKSHTRLSGRLERQPQDAHSLLAMGGQGWCQDLSLSVHAVAKWGKRQLCRARRERHHSK